MDWGNVDIVDQRDIVVIQMTQPVVLGHFPLRSKLKESKSPDVFWEL